MSRPADIPQDVWQAAQLHIAGPLPEGDVAAGDRVARWAEVHVARAILAERERCAKVCLDYQWEHKIVGERYAAEIRKGSV